ncbi:TetR/AcrR family transcriptional regulator [Pararhizobium haloflavum]|uniref:TetR/AcrR family transcriptional regulator n=1 Tax=Pararhizobium haloflavum TaxID=2037914 RepID=UPI000C19D97F|nr:TetR/AcrR family transcriptional regulator [Pararhizobium haloflavum]
MKAPRAARSRIREAAIHLFVNHGYAGVSVDEIARAANVSKPTIYSHFGGKEELFVFLLKDVCDRLLAPLAGPGRDGDVYETLIDHARAYARAVLQPDIVAMHRLFTAEARRFPELGRRYFAAGPEVAHEGLAIYFARLRERGVLKIDDPKLAAEQFSGMVLSPLRLKLLFGCLDSVDDDEIERQVEQAVRIFLQGTRSGG